MDISVIVPIYGVEKYIDKSLRSLFSQTKIEDVEFILVNDCTPDNSMVVAAKVIADFPDCDINVINHTLNSGVAVARQTGMDAARGEYTIHFDPDDWCEPQMLEELYNKAKETDADIVVCDFIVNTTTNISYIHQKVANTNIDNVNLLISSGCASSLWNKLIKRSLYTKNNIGFIPNLNVGEDLLCNIKLFFQANKVVHIPKAYFHYQHRENSMMTTISYQRQQERIAVCNNIALFVEENNLERHCNSSLLTRKAITKLELLSSSNGDSQKEYAKIFPELTKHIKNIKKMSKATRIALYNASRGRVWVYNFIKYLVGLKKKNLKKNK